MICCQKKGAVHIAVRLSYFTFAHRQADLFIVHPAGLPVFFFELINEAHPAICTVCHSFIINFFVEVIITLLVVIVASHTAAANQFAPVG